MPGRPGGNPYGHHRDGDDNGDRDRLSSRSSPSRAHARTFRTKTDARKWAAERESDLRRGEWLDPRLARVTFGAWADDYLTYARRTVGVPRSLVDDLAVHLADRADALGRPLAADDYVFTAPRGGPLRRDLLFKRFLRPAIDASGLPSNLRLHDLRHTCAAILIELGAHPKAIQERLGRSSITVTMDVYGHLFPALNEALTERLEDVFAAARRQPQPSTGASVTPLRSAGD